MFLDTSATLRLGVFFAVFVLFLILENIRPLSEINISQIQRRATNLMLILLSSMLVRFVVPISVLAMAVVARDNNWGLTNLLNINFIPALILSILLLDMSIYWQHRLFHWIPFLWSFHRVHHADRSFDVTTGIRFHPLEMLLSVFYKIIMVLLIGASPESVLLFEIILNLSAMFSHANIRIPARLEKTIRKVIVTPYMHRVHHSVLEKEMNKNFGFCLSVWDRLFGSYLQCPRGGQKDMEIGLSAYQDARPIKLWWCLMLPFKK